MTLKQQIQNAIPELNNDNFGGHASDLYIRARPIVLQWFFKNYKFFKQCTTFTDYNNDLWIEVPFGRFDEYLEERIRSK